MSLLLNQGIEAVLIQAPTHHTGRHIEIDFHDMTVIINTLSVTTRF